MRLGLWLSCIYLFAVYFRPQELYPALQQIPNLMDILGGLAVLATLLDVLAGARPRLKQPQVWLLTLFVLWAAFSVAAFIATRRAICSLTAASRKLLNRRCLNATGTIASSTSAALSMNS